MGSGGEPFAGMFVTDDFSRLFDLLFTAAACAVLLLSQHWHREIDRAEYGSLVLFATSGMMILAHAANLAVSIPELGYLNLRNGDANQVASLATNQFATGHIFAQILADFTPHNLAESVCILFNSSNHHLTSPELASWGVD